MWQLLRSLRDRLFPSPEERFWRNRAYIVSPNGWRKPFRKLYVMANRRILVRCNANIPCVKNVSPFATPHGLAGIYVSFGAKVGPGCTILHQVTIGSNTFRDSAGMGAPVIGSNVFIGAGAKIIGKVTVGDNARIGANCVVTRDVPANATVVLPAPASSSMNRPETTPLSHGLWRQENWKKHRNALKTLPPPHVIGPHSAHAVPAPPSRLQSNPRIFCLAENAGIAVS